jgi:hypothetical protein
MAEEVRPDERHDESSQSADEAAPNESEASRTEPLPESIARGRESRTPFALLGSVAFVAWTAVALVSGVIFLLWYLV